MRITRTRFKSSEQFTKAKKRIFAETSVESRLRQKAAVVLERIAFGGGAVRWYYCRDGTHLKPLMHRLSPGSAVSFYFDDRFTLTHFSDGTRQVLEEFVNSRKEDVIIGVVPEGGLVVAAEPVFGTGELAEYLEGVTAGATIMFGEFPGRDNDGIRAITVTIPDLDGVVRGHAY